MGFVNVFVSAGVLAWPLGIFMIVAVFIICDRFIYVRRRNIVPREILKSLLDGKFPPQQMGDHTVVGRIVNFYTKCHPEPEAIKSYAQYEILKLERGMFLLDIVVTGAPLLGLLGTVSGLTKVFGNFSFTSGGSNTDILVSGIALALTTTMLGLVAAIPALIGSAYINRKIDKYAAEIDVIVERLIDMSVKNEAR